jgi:multiple sugar transport system substrate-binding protein
MKKYRLLLIFFLMLFLLGCGNRNPKKYSRGKELVFWHSMGGPMLKVLNGLIDEYNHKEPEYKIRAINKGSYSALIQSLLAGIPARNLPDISQAYESWTSKLIDNDIIVPLQDYFDKLPEEEKNDFFPAFIKNNTYQGKLWSLPCNKSVPVLYYNKDMFKKFDVEPPKRWSPIESESEFDTVCKILTRDEDQDGIPNQWGYAFNLSVWTFECLLLQSGGEITDRLEKQPKFYEQPGIDALKWWKSLLDRKYGFKRQGFDFQNNFAAGDVGMIMTSCVSKYFLKNKLTFNLGITEVPYYKKKGVILSGTNIVILKSSKKREEAAWEFLHWLTSPEITAKWAIKTNYLPVRRSALETTIMKAAIEEDPTILVPMKELDYAYFEPRSSGWYTSRNILSEAIEMIMLDMIEPEEGLKKAANRIKTELNK